MLAMMVMGSRGIGLSPVREGTCQPLLSVYDRGGREKRSGSSMIVLANHQGHVWLPLTIIYSLVLPFPTVMGNLGNEEMAQWLRALWFL